MIAIDDFKNPDTPTNPDAAADFHQKDCHRAVPQGHDPWEDWNPRWTVDRKAAAFVTGIIKEPGKIKKTPQKNAAAKNPAAKTIHDTQESHSPTETVSYADPLATRQSNSAAARQSNSAAARQTGRRRIVDARLWDGLTIPQQNAATLIAKAYETFSRGLGFTTSDWQRVRSSGGASNIGAAHSRLISGYTEWARDCAKQKIGHAMIIDILVFGHSCRAVDRDRRLRAGTARQNLAAGLDLYCRLHGWK